MSRSVLPVGRAVVAKPLARLEFPAPHAEADKIRTMFLGGSSGNPLLIRRFENLLMAREARSGMISGPNKKSHGARGPLERDRYSFATPKDAPGRNLGFGDWSFTVRLGVSYAVI
jgi:hypothetical protein